MDETFLKSIQPPQFTQDLFELEQAPQHMVFDYGAIMYDKDTVCSAYTFEKLSLFRLKPNKWIIPLKTSHLPRARIAGTAYLMASDEIRKLDKQMHNGVYFERKKVPILLEMPSEDGPFTKQWCWTYVGKNEQWEEAIKWEREHYRYKANKHKHQFQQVGQVIDNRPLVHNHFAVNTLRIEHQQLPTLPERTVNEAVSKYCHERNTFEVEYHKKHNKKSYFRRS